MKEYLIPILAILLISTSFGAMNINMTMGHMSNVSHSNNVTPRNNVTHENSSFINKTTKGNVTITMNKTENGFTRTITTPRGIIVIQKTNGTIQITVNNTRIGNLIQVIKNKEKRAYIFHILHNTHLNSTIKREIRERIITAMRNSTLRKEILQNKTLLMEIIHPRVKPIIETGIIKNTTIIENGNSTMISMKVVVHKKLFGFIPVNIDENVITNDTYYKIKRPWWSIFAI